jgi:hypothetical protein
MFIPLAHHHLCGEVAPDQVCIMFQQGDADAAGDRPHFKDACALAGGIQQGSNARVGCSSGQ